MSDYETLLLETSDGVATLTLNRPDRYNAFDATMVAELPRAWAQLRDDADVRAVVLTGAGAAAQGWSDLLARPGEIGEVEAFGAESCARAVPVSVAEGVDWFAVVTVPQATVLANVNAMMKMSAMVIATARVFLSVGAHEQTVGDTWKNEGFPLEILQRAAEVDRVRAFTDRLRGRRYPNLHLEAAVFAGEYHLTAPPAMLTRGLLSILEHDARSGH